MKRLLSFCVVLGVGVALGRMLDGVAAKAEGGGAGLAASRNGDADGRDDITINDPIYLLNWLFLGGPEPVPCPPSGAGSGLPDTGQTQCFDCSGKRCEGVIIQDFLTGQDSFHPTGCPNDANRFTDHGDGTVTDNCTGLMWQKATADVNRDGQNSNADKSNWCGALDFCEHLSFAGHEDWRLPNVRELQSIVDYGRFNPAIDPGFGAFSDAYWSSTTDAGHPGFAWIVGFDFGFVISTIKGSNSYVRAVRSGP